MDRSIGQVIVRMMLSFCVMICSHELELPHASVATQVLVMTGQPEEPITSENVITGSLSQLSNEVAIPVTIGSVLLLQRMMTSAGHDIMGGELSSIVMFCVH